MQLIADAVGGGRHPRPAILVESSSATPSSTMRSSPARSGRIRPRTTTRSGPPAPTSGCSTSTRLSLVYEHMLSAYLRLGRFDAARERLAAWGGWARRIARSCRLNRAVGRSLRRGSPAAAVAARAEFWRAATTPAVRAVITSDVRPSRPTSATQAARTCWWTGPRANILAAHGRFDDATELYRRPRDREGSCDGFLHQHAVQRARAAGLPAVGAGCYGRARLELRACCRRSRQLPLAVDLGPVRRARRRPVRGAGAARDAVRYAARRCRGSSARPFWPGAGSRRAAPPGARRLRGTGRLRPAHGGLVRLRGQPCAAMRDGLARACRRSATPPVPRPRWPA